MSRPPVEESTYHLSADVQIVTLVMALFVIGAIWMGLRSVWFDWKVDWETEDMIEDYYMDRDQHNEGLSGERWN